MGYQATVPASGGSPRMGPSDLCPRLVPPQWMEPRVKGHRHDELGEPTAGSPGGMDSDAHHCCDRRHLDWLAPQVQPGATHIVLANLIQVWISGDPAILGVSALLRGRRRVRGPDHPVSVAQSRRTGHRRTLLMTQRTATIDTGGGSQAWCAQAKAPLLDDQAAVLDVEHARNLGDIPRLHRGDAQLEPQGGGTGSDGLSSDVGRLPRWPEYIDQAHLLGDVGKHSVDRFSEDLVGMRVYWDDPPTMLLHVGRNRVRRLLRSDTGTYHGDRVVGDEDTFDDRISVVHPSTVPA